MKMTDATMRILAMFEGVRKHRIDQLKPLSEAEAFQVPPGFRNNIHWHVGHLLHVQLAHWYTRRNLPLPESAQSIDFKRYFRDGKSPADYDNQTPTFTTLLSLFREYSENLSVQYGDFLEEPMTQGFAFLGMDFKTLADDLYLLVYHEGEHGPMFERLFKALNQPAPSP